MRLIKRTLLALLVTLISITVPVVWLLATETGFSWLVQQGSRWVAGLKIDRVQGHLFKGFQLHGLKYRDEQTDAKLKQFNFAWQAQALPQSRLAISQILLTDLDLQLTPAKTAEEPASAPPEFKLPDINLPLAIELDNIQVKNASIKIADNPPISLNNAQLQLLVNQKVTLKKLQLASNLGDIQGHGSMGLSQPHTLDGQLAWQVDLKEQVKTQGKIHLGGDLNHYQLTSTGEAIKPELPKIQWDLTADGNLKEIKIQQLKLNTLSGQLQSQGVVHWSPQLDWDVHLIAQNIQPAHQWPEWPAQINAELHSQGKIQNQQPQGQLTIKSVDGKVLDYPLILQGFLAFAPDKIQLTDFKLNSTENQVVLNALFNPKNEEIQADWVLAANNLAQALPHAKGAINSQGQLAGTLKNPQIKTKITAQKVAMDDLSVEQLDADVDLSLKPNKNNQLKLHVVNVVQQEENVLQDLKLDFHGTPDAHQVQLTAQRMQQERLALALQGGFARAQQDWAQIDWAKLTWRGVIKQLTVFVPQAGEWRLQKASELNVDLAQQSAQLSHFHWQSGKNSIQLNTKIDPQNINADWRLQLANLGALLPQSKGQVQSTGQLMGTLEQPKIKTKITGNSLFYPLDGAQTLALGRVNADVDISLDPKQKQALEIKIKDFKQNNTAAVDDLTLSFTGVLGQHQLKLNTQLPTKERLSLALAGGLNLKDFKQIEVDTLKWQGKIQSMTLFTPLLETWRMAASTDLTLSPQSAALGAHCLVSSMAQFTQTQVCGNGQWQADKGATWQAAVKQWPLLWAQQWLPDDIQLQRGQTAPVADVRFNGRFDQNGRAQGQITAQISPFKVKLTLPEEQSAVLSHNGTQLQGNIGAQGLNAQLQFKALDDLALTTVVNIEGLNQWPLAKKLPLYAKINLTNNSLEQIKAFVPPDMPVDELHAELKLKAELQTVLADFQPQNPDVSAQLWVDKIHALVPMLGIALEQGQVKLSAKDLQNIDLDAVLYSGKKSKQAERGQLHLRGQAKVNTATDWQAQMQLTGKQFEVINNPTAWVILTPDLSFDAQPKRLKIRGGVTVPDAHITPQLTGYDSNSVQVDKDVVIIDEVKTLAREEAKQPEALDPDAMQVDADVQLVLAEKIRLKVADFKSHLAGHLQIKMPTLAQPPTAKGIVKVLDGTYRAYGQDLKIETGQILFSGMNIDNPALNIKAVRLIEDDPIVKYAGVHITGLAQEPELLLFSQPMVGEDRILSYITFGKDLLANTSGKSIGMGYYLWPQLYVSYGLDLADKTNSFKIRYELNKRWGAEAKTSAEDKGADISYTIEY